MSGLIRKASLRGSLRRKRTRRMSFTKEVFIQDAILDGNVDELTTIFLRSNVENCESASTKKGGSEEDAACNVDITLTGGKTPLHLAVDAGRLNVVEFLVRDCRANVNCTDNSGWTPLHRAVGKGRTEMVRYLLDNGVDPYNRTPDGSLPLSLALDRGDSEMVSLLSRYGRQAAKKDDDRQFYNTLALLTERQLRKEGSKSPPHRTVHSTAPTSTVGPLRRTATAPVVPKIPKIAVCMWPGGCVERRNADSDDDDADDAFCVASATILTTKRRANSDDSGQSRKSTSCPASPSDSPTSPDGTSHLVIDYFNRPTSQRRSFRETLATLAGRRKANQSSVWQTVSPAASPKRARSPR